MGLGDNLMAAGFAKGAKARGKRIAFGDGRKIIWDHHSELIFRGNPNIAQFGHEGAGDIEWVPFYRGNRIYNTQGNGKWIWNRDFKAVPGEMFFNEHEILWARQQGRGFVVIEPNVPEQKTVAPNKQWGVDNYNNVATLLKDDGHEVVQFATGRFRLPVRQIKPPTFRHALAVLKRASLYIGPEGGLHHGSAAVGIPAVVMFGGFIPPSVTGYTGHTNLTGGAVACGSLQACEHCLDAMRKIRVDEVMHATSAYLRVAA